MRKLIFIVIIFIGNFIFGQDSNSDWEKLNQSTSLKEYIKKQGYDYLEFNPHSNDSISIKEEWISHEGVKTKIIIRDTSVLEKPLIVINNYPLKNLTVLEFIYLKDIEKIELYKPSAKLSSDYGYRAKNGLINIKMGKKVWKKLKRKYSR